MKRIILKYVAVVAVVLNFASCNEDFLAEVPKDFLSPENAYTSLAGFETAITTLHTNVRDFYNYEDGAEFFILPGLGTDLAVHGENFTSGPRMDYNAVTPTDGFVKNYWARAYKLIKNANAIITRADLSNAKWKSETEKNQVVAEAKFFRAWGYRFLANMFGGVPIIREETSSPKIDYTRATRNEVYEFAKEDLEFATQYLPENEKVPGRITKAAAYHLLTEVLISLKDWDGAITAASAVISNPNYQLMTQRFGRRTSVPGDVYWDLFQRGNQNRTSGNKETIWALQIEWKTPGGGNLQWNGTQMGWPTERAWGTRYHSLKDPDGVNGFVLSDEMGRPVGRLVPTYYMQRQIWQSDWNNDMRNSPYNIKRQFVYNNPASKYFGQVADSATLSTQEIRYFHPYFMKATTPNDHPDGIINTGQVFKDIYAMRLAETYLLRAEAYLGKGRTDLAAADINVVRARANAKPVAAANVNIEYILDERVRELHLEEFRTMTLTRLGLMYDRTKRFSKIIWGNGVIEESNAAKTVQPKDNLWPIPQTEIDLNGGAVLEQNPGYN